MAAFEVIALDTATPQLRAPGASDTYTFPRAVEMPLGTANGVLYLNGSKVMTSGSGLTFDGTTQTLTAVNTAYRGQLSLNGGATGFSQITFYRGSTTNTDQIGSILTADAATPYLLFNARNNAVQIWQLNDSEQMRLTTTGLGIGTSSPLGKLDVREANRANSTNITNIGVYTTTAQAADVGGTIGLGGIWDSASGYAPFGSIRGGKENSTVNNYAGYLAFQTIPDGGTLSERMRLDSSGNLGLGVTPSAWVGDKAMQVNWGSISSGYEYSVNISSVAYRDNATWKYLASSQGPARYEQINSAHQWYTAPSGTAGNAISFTQAMTLDASGNLGIGSTSPGAKLEVVPGVNNIAQIKNASHATFSGLAAAVTFSRGSDGITDLAAVFGWNNGGLAIAARDGLAFATGGSTSYSGTTERARIPFAGGMVVGTAALATTATDGFLYVPTCAGTPTGTPTTQTGTAPIVINTTNNKLYFYSGGAWRDAGP